MMKWLLSSLLLTVLTLNMDAASAAEDEACLAPRQQPRRTNICLNMIVKNEARVLPRLVESVKDVIDYYVIVDTGSTDGTVTLIPAEMQKYGIDGRVERREWVNFSTNRNQALQLAMEHCNTEWVLFIDADDELVVLDPNFYEKLETGVTYQISKHSYSMRYPLKNLINIGVSKAWKWFGAVHEYISLNDAELDKSHRVENRDDVYIKVNVGQGARSHNVTDEEKFLRDARLLEDDLVRDPDNPRSVYYLGQSYRDAGHKEKALETFRKRVVMGGWDQETFYAQYQIGRIVKELGKPPEVVQEEYMKAWESRPHRIEPLFDLAEFFRRRKEYPKSFMFAITGVNMTMSTDSLFNNYEAYKWKMKDELCTVAYYVGRMEEGRWACQEVLRLVETGEVELQDDVANRIRGNLGFYLKKG